jgi:hypothetical protein
VHDVREEPAVEKAVNAAYLRWARAEEAWEAVTWAIAHDPYGAGPPLTESGKTRQLVFDGARSIGMPSIRIVYVIEPACVIIHEASFEEASHLYAGRA